MKACGITAEFNPLHNGHVYIMNEARRLTGCDAVVVAMSGNYVQRGEPAITDKWARTEAALSCGADLVIEIPTVFCLSDAGRYARAGVTLLESLGCTEYICFGSGSGDENTLKELATLIKEHAPEIKERIKRFALMGLSYPAAREKALTEMMTDGPDISAVKKVLGNPNDVLALEYMISSKTAKSVCVKRKGSGYDAAFDKNTSLQSAGGIRSLIRNEGMDIAGDKIRAFIPEKSFELLAGEILTYPDEWTEILKYAVLNSSPEKIDNCPSGGEGLGNLYKKAVKECNTWNEIIMYCKSKRYTYTRLSRLAMQIILGMSDADNDKDPAYIRILGFNEKGRELLSYIKRKELCKLPILTNINKEKDNLSEHANEMIDREVKYTDIYNMITGRESSVFSDYVHLINKNCRSIDRQLCGRGDEI